MSMNIHIENLSFKYKSFGSGLNSTLSQINLKINKGEFLSLVGPSGSGKTTLMQQITGLLKPDSGRILINGVDLWAKSTSKTQIRRKIGLVFQFPEMQLFEETVYEDVAFGPRNLGLAENEIKRRVRQAIESVYLDYDKFKDRVPIHLSEGEKRRVAIAGVLAMEPECLVLDEPTAGLDNFGVQAVINLLKDFHAKGRTVILISHNLDLVGALVDRIVVICAGKLQFDGHKRHLFRKCEFLESVGLFVPRIQNISFSLKQTGLVNSEEIYTVADLKREIAKTYKLESRLNTKNSSLHSNN